MKNIMSFVLCVSILATDGTLDTSFGTNGIVTIPALSGADILSTATFIQVDGKIVVVGSVCTGSSTANGFIARINPTGELDTTFNPTGTTPGILFLNTLATLQNGSILSSLIIQPDGKIVAIGRSRDAQSGTFFLVIRVTPDGTVDPEFNGGNPVTTPFNGVSFIFSQSVALDKNGSLTVVGSGSLPVNNNSVVLLARYLSDGSLDTTFNGSGTQQFALNQANSSVLGLGVVIQADQKIVISGYTFIAILNTTNNASIYFARFNTDGSLDTTFGAPNGYVLPTLGVSADNNYSLLLQPDGKFLVGITVQPLTTFLPQVARFNPDGTFDTSFGISGVTDTSAFTTDTQTAQIGLQSDGKIIMMGTQSFSAFCAARYTAEGILDTAFNAPQGFVVTPFPQGDFFNAYSLSIQQNGYIIGSGTVSADQMSVALVRYQDSPALLPTVITSFDIAGTAQPKSVVGVFSGSMQLCLTDDITGIWSCALSGSQISAVAHYPAGYVNIMSTCTSAIMPQSVLSAAIISKYCPC